MFVDQEYFDCFFIDLLLMNLMKQVGYKIFWIINQQIMIKCNIMLMIFVQQIDVQFYLNNQCSQNVSQLDGVVLVFFVKVLDDLVLKKFIVVYLFGIYMNYKYCYFVDYVCFVDCQGVLVVFSDDQVEVYNSYDNVVLYNDYVVFSLIKGFVNSDLNGFLVYFLDYGEEVFDEVLYDCFGCNEGDLICGMYIVFFLVWILFSWQQIYLCDLQVLVD